MISVITGFCFISMADTRDCDTRDCDSIDWGVKATAHSFSSEHGEHDSLQAEVGRRVSAVRRSGQRREVSGSSNAMRSHDSGWKGSGEGPDRAMFPWGD